ncbi:Phosphoacetylglucosamine mutase [Mycena kentingensis (nom. inval.)]|nr:Phosphoacetylglucosamine mutase [Mycena kentingensis (nom. inval.)]
MPAERSKYTRRSQADGDAIVWTLPAAPMDPSGFGFAPNLTEETFADEPPPLVDRPEHPFTTFVFADETSFVQETPQPAKRVHARKMSVPRVPRPPNAFILFRSSFIKAQTLSPTVESNHSTLSKIIGMTWKNLSAEERDVWRMKAVEAVAEHKRKFPTYSYRPRKAKKGQGDGETDKPPAKAKRRVREAAFTDVTRCEKIAEFLKDGKNGAELDAAVQAFDRVHVPKIVTRFEAPITARAYRRSSSVPAPNSDDSRAFLAPAPKSPDASSSRRRSSSVGAVARPQEQSRPRGPSLFLDTGAVHPNLFGSFSFDPKQEVVEEGFDFSSFSFANHTSPAATVGYDPLSSVPQTPCSPHETLFSLDHKLEPMSPGAFSPVDSIDVSALIANDWLLHGQAFASGYPAPAPASEYCAAGFAPAYSPTSPTSPGFCTSFKNLGFDEQAFCAPPPPPPDAAAMAGLSLAQLEAEMASFMAQYSL